MQNKIDLVVAYANKIALSLSMKELEINERIIMREGRIIYSLDNESTKYSFQKYSGLGGEFNSREETSLCKSALQMVKIGMKINDLIAKRGKILIEETFASKQTQVKVQESNNQHISYQPFEVFRELDITVKSNKQKIRRYVIANYKRSPKEIVRLISSLNISQEEVKKWIQYNRKTERRIKLREEIIKLGLQQDVSLALFKKTARKIYKTRLFRACDRWCLNYIKKYRLEHLVEIPKQLQSNDS